MSLPLDFHEDVDAELDKAYRWYEGQQSGLGTEFLDEVNAVFTSVSATPLRFGIAKADVRLALVRRFPYAVYFRSGPKKVRILAVIHTARSPRRWQSRI